MQESAHSKKLQKEGGNELRGRLQPFLCGANGKAAFATNLKQGQKEKEREKPLPLLLV